MNEQANVQCIQELYAAFGRGDIAAVLDALADDVEWWVAGPEAIPYAGTFRGRDGVTRFFERYGGAVEPFQFEPREFIAQGNQVVVVGYEKIRARSTGRVAENDWAMVFDLRGGRIVRFRSFEDSHAVAAIFG